MNTRILALNAPILVLAALTVLVLPTGCVNSLLKGWGSGSAQSSPESAVVDPGWLTDYEAAKEQARNTDRLLLAMFTGSDWCSWCRKLESEVFQTPEFRNWAEQNVVLLKLDYPKRSHLPPPISAQNQMLRERYRSEVKGFPTVLLLTPEGEIQATAGYVAGGPSAWISTVRSQMQSPAEVR